MRTSTEITTKLVAATLLTGFFGLSQSEACEGRRVDQRVTLRTVAQAVSGVKDERPAGFVDERTQVSSKFSPVGQITVGEKGPTETGNLIEGLENSKLVGSCYILTTKHILQQKNFDTVSIGQSNNGKALDLMGLPYSDLKQLPQAKVKFTFGENFSYQISGRIVGGGESRNSVTATEKEKYGPTMADEDQDWMIVLLDQPISSKYAKPFGLNRAKENLVGRYSQGEEFEVSSVGLPGEKIREFGGKLQLFEDQCSAGAVKNGDNYYVQSSCTGTPGSSGSGIVRDNLILSLQSRLHYRDGFKSAYASGTRGPSVAHLADKIEKIMKDNPCPN